MKEFAILAEDRTDAESLTVLVKRILAQDNATVWRKGFSGCGELRRKVSSHISMFASQGATHFIICHDADDNDPVEVRRNLRDILKDNVKLNPTNHAIIVPKEELEAWIIADEAAISQVVTDYRPGSPFKRSAA